MQESFRGRKKQSMVSLIEEKDMITCNESNIVMSQHRLDWS